MNLLAKSALATLLVSLVATAVQAQDNTATPRVDERQAVQQRRIDNGVATGQLTPREARRMQRQQRAVGAAETQAKSDGVVTKTERRKLDRMQAHPSRNIHRQKHDAQGAPTR